jgi:hypothetical protein
MQVSCWGTPATRDGMRHISLFFTESTPKMLGKQAAAVMFNQRSAWLPSPLAGRGPVHPSAGAHRIPPYIVASQVAGCFGRDRRNGAGLPACSLRCGLFQRWGVHGIDKGVAGTACIDDGASVFASLELLGQKRNVAESQPLLLIPHPAGIIDFACPQLRMRAICVKPCGYSLIRHCMVRRKPDSRGRKAWLLRQTAS